jgi:hypothetical protein
VRILFDQGSPAPLRESLRKHDISTAYERGWSTLKNGELLEAAEREGFEVFVTTDARLRYQQNLAGRKIAIVCLLSTSWPRIQRVAASIAETIGDCKPGSYVEVRIP